MLTTDGGRTRDGLNSATIRALLAEKATSTQPFFLALGFHKPHLPWTAPQRFFDLHRVADFERPAEPALQGVPAIALQTELSGFAQPDSAAAARRAYYACVSFIDHQLGLVLDELERRDLWRSTLVVFFSDHGFHLGDHGGLWAKLSAFEISTRVPLLLAGPGVPAGRVIASPVELIDVYPTLAALAGFAPPAGLDGRSLAAAWQEKGADARAAYSLVYHYDGKQGRDVAGRSVMTADSRYTTWDDGAAGHEFYRRSSDRDELRNLADESTEKAAVASAEARLKKIPAPKAGRAERPRALVKAAAKP
jgi:uncharacterized sulfatase